MLSVGFTLLVFELELLLALLAPALFRASATAAFMPLLVNVAPLTPSTLVDCDEIILGIIPEHLS